MGKTATKILILIAIMCLAVAGMSCGKKNSGTITSLDSSSGPRSGYQNVTIHGSGFTDVTAVSFGAKQALSFATKDSTQIVAVTPPGELGKAVDVTVTTKTGKVTIPKGFSYWNYDLKVTKGSKTLTYTLDQLKAMPSATGYWGAVNDKPYATAKYTGVSLLRLVDTVGGRTSSEQIVVKSADGFKAVYTPEILDQMSDGTYPMYRVNGTEVTTNDRQAQLIVAFEKDGQALPAGKAPFRVVPATTQNDRLSQGPWGPAMAYSIEVIEADSTSTSLETKTTVASHTAVDPSNGARSGYQSVTINGSGFTNVTGVMFGSRKAVGFTVENASKLVAVTPVGDLGKTVDVTVMTKTGKITLPKAFTYWNYDLKLTKGNKSITYTLEQLKAMKSVTGYWGAHKDPRPYDTDQYRGVPLLTLLDAVGGLKDGETITTTSADGFVVKYELDRLRAMSNGTMEMWDPQGTPIQTADRSAQLIVAYEIDTKNNGTSWAPFDPGTGPLRIVAITSKDGRVSQGKYNPFLLLSVEVIGP